MQIRLSSSHMRQIEEHLEAAYPNEGAGFLLGRLGTGAIDITVILPMINRREAEAQHNRYDIQPHDYAKAELEAAKQGLDLVGVFHSHPDHPAQPSQFDLDHAWPNFTYFITSVQKGKAAVTHAWRMLPDRSAFEEDTLEIIQPNPVTDPKE